MFEEYLEDADSFIAFANEAGDEREARRSYRAAVMYIMGALEAFVNFIADTFAHGNVLPAYEIAFLQDKRFGIHKGQFRIWPQSEYHRLEEKLQLLIRRFVRDFDFHHDPIWCRVLDLKKLRDSISHPRQDEDEMPVAEYKRRTEAGLAAIIEIMNQLSKGIFDRPLRKRLTDLIPD